MKVKVKTLDEVKTTDPETEMYLQRHGGKVGTLVGITRSKRGVPSFHVKLDKEYIGYFYENELVTAD